MATWLIGDVQGCNQPLGRLLADIGFEHGKDTAVLLGDLVNRGPDSLGVLRRVRAMGSSARCIAGNHDLHALATWHGLRKPGKGDTLADLLAAQDAPELFAMVETWPLCLQTDGWLCVHAGVLPSCSAAKVVAMDADFTWTVGQFGAKKALDGAFGNRPAAWSDGLAGMERFRVIVNAFTRLRFCTAQGVMDFEGKTDVAPPGHMPWFEVPGRLTANTPIAFGHWSTLGLVNRPNLLGLDTGCVWGGKLTAARVEGGLVLEVVQVGTSLDELGPENGFADLHRMK